ncbi:hypothetical protein BDF22DRAFT_378320 [Syncephalis plumigaleata]|nr:hypothetical protein BDF22DRAFT_378320 [Syncephalis plumigaleata]
MSSPSTITINTGVKKAATSGPPTPQSPILRGRGTPTMPAAKSPSMPGDRVKPLPSPSRPPLSVVTNFNSNGSPNTSGVTNAHRSPVRSSPSNPAPSPRQLATSTAAATLLKTHSASPGPVSPDVNPTSPTVALSSPSVMTPPPRSSSLSPQSSPTTVRARGFPILKGNPPTANGAPSGPSSPSDPSRTIVVAAGNPRSPSAPPTPNGLQRSANRGAVPVRMASASNLNGRAGSTRSSPTAINGPGANHLILRQKLSAPNLSLPTSNKPRCVIPPPPMEPPPEHLVKAQQQQQLRQQNHLGAPRSGPLSPRMSSLAGRPGELQRSLSAGAVPQSANQTTCRPAGTLPPSPGRGPPPLVRASSLNTKSPVQVTSPPGTSVSANREHRPLGHRVPNTPSTPTTPTTPGTSANPVSQPPRGWRSRAEEAISEDNANNPELSSAAPNTPPITGKPCDRCQGAGVRKITKIVTGPSTAGNSVCSQCRGRGVLRE